MAGLTPAQIAEIHRKATSGIKLTNPNHSTQYEYDKYKAALLETERQRKQSQGIPLNNGKPAATPPSKPIDYSGINFGGPGAGFGGQQPTTPTTPQMGPPPVNNGGSYAPAPEPPPTKTDELYQGLMDIIQQMQGGQVDQEARIKDQAARAAKEQTDAFNSLIGNLGTQQSSELQGVQNGLQSAKQDLEDTTFQKYLQARQTMANRGLAGSGIASDQDTRLLLSNGRNLANLGRDAMTRTGEIQARYGGKLADARQKLAGVSQSNIESDLMSKLFSSGGGQLGDAAKLYADLIGKTIGYDYTKPGDELKYRFEYDKLDTQDRQFYDKLDSTEKLAYEKLDSNERVAFAKMSSTERVAFAKMDSSEKVAYAKMDSNEKIAWAKLDSQERQLVAKLNSTEKVAAAKLRAQTEVQLTKIMGVDSNGNMTLDAKKLGEQMRHNQASEAGQWARIQQSGSELNYKFSALNQKAAEFSSKITNDQWKSQATNLRGLMNSEAANLRSLRSSLANNPNDYSMLQIYNESAKKYEGYMTGLEQLAGLSIPKATSGSGGGSSYKPTPKNTNTVDYLLGLGVKI